MQTALDWLVSHQDQMADDLEQLCNINSGSDSVPGLEQAAKWLIDYFAPLDLPCHKIELPSFQQLDDQGAAVTQQTGVALRWDLHSAHENQCPRILLSIHYDTVYGPRSDFQRCERYEAAGSDGTIEHRMRGPGVIDAKGGIVVLRWAVMAAQRFLDLSKIQLSVVLTPDEEIGSPSTSALWRQVADQFDFAMLYEPAMADGSLVSQRKGTGTFIFVVRGKSAHSGRNFQEGRNAVVHACKIAMALDAHNGVRQDVTINVGRIRGGDAVNVVPDLAVLRVNVRVSSPEDQAWIEARVQQVVQVYQDSESGYQVELHGGINSAPKIVDGNTQRWMEMVSAGRGEYR